MKRWWKLYSEIYLSPLTLGRLSLPSPNTSSEQVCSENDNITQRFRVCLHSNVSSFYWYLPSYCALVFLCKVNQTSDHHNHHHPNTIIIIIIIIIIPTSSSLSSQHHHHHYPNIITIILFNTKSAGWCSRLPTTFRLLCWKKRKLFHLVI